MVDLENIIYYRTDTWPSYKNLEKATNTEIADFIKKIYQEGVFDEIEKLLTSKEYPNCKGIGHIVLIAICCSIDSLSAYANGGGKVRCRFTNFISKYFPDSYSGKEEKIYISFRCDSVHGWNLHKSFITGKVSDPSHLKVKKGIIQISLYDFFNDLNKAFQSYYEKIKSNKTIKKNLLIRYKEIKSKYIKKKSKKN